MVADIGHAGDVKLSSVSGKNNNNNNATAGVGAIARVGFLRTIGIYRYKHPLFLVRTKQTVRVTQL